LYLASSLINHSCEPNLVKSFYGSTVVYRASAPIRKGEQLTEANYIQRIIDGAKERQKELQMYYRFTCKCEACVKNWPNLKEIGKIGKKSIKESTEPLTRILTKPELKGLVIGEFDQMMTLVTHIFPMSKALLPQMINILTHFSQEPHKERCKVYVNMRLCLTYHYMALGGAIFSEAARELFTCQGFPHFPMMRQLELVKEDAETFRNIYYASHVTFCSP
jgi:hypothetical protein